VARPKVEIFYWVTITFSQTLGTALGDWMADSTGLGYEGGALVFIAGLAILAGAYYWSSVSRVLLFWAAFILTRPLGAPVGDFLDKPVNHGGPGAEPAARIGRRRCVDHRVHRHSAPAAGRSPGKSLAGRHRARNTRRDRALEN
jgi:hypothetical protein